jgi:acetyltransferase-like isoleucine patch superfamily enzyme
MKKLFILKLVFLIVFGLNAQTIENTNICGTVYSPQYFDTISTDWRSTINNKINDFNWNNQNANVRTFSTMNNSVIINGSNFYGADDVELPFFRTTGSNVNNNNLLMYAINPFNVDNLDISPEDGWELVQYDFGGKLVKQGLPAKANEINPYPHFIIYNRYNSKLRIFFLVPNPETFNGAYIQAIFGSQAIFKQRKTALFAHAANNPPSVKNFNPEASFASTSAYDPGNTQPSGRILQWLTAEFDLAYDPCTCKIKDEVGANSKIQFNLCTQQLTKIDLVGEGTSQTTNIADPNSPGGHNTGAEKTAFSNLLKQGQKHYNQWDAYKKYTEKALDQGYSLWSKKLEKEFFKEYKGGIIDPKDGKLINDLATLKTTDLYKDWLKADQNSNPTLNALKTFKNVASVIPYVGVAIGLVDYLASGGKKSETTVAAPSVSHTKHEFKITGNLTYSTTRNVTLNTPGALPQVFTSINSSNDDNGRFVHGTYLKSSEFPMYNEPLGVFNILNEPKFEIVPMDKEVYFIGSFDEILPTFIDNGAPAFKDVSQTHLEAFKTKIVEVRLKEIPKFVVNPAAGLELISIDAAIVLEYQKNEAGFDLYHGNYKDAASFDAIPFHPSYYNKNLSLEQRVEEIEKSGLELEYVSDNYPSVKGSVIRFRTKYTPLECLTSPSFVSIGWANQPKVFIKYLVRFKRKFKGSSAMLETNNYQEEPGMVNMVYTIDVTKSYENAGINESIERGKVILEAKANFSDWSAGQYGVIANDFKPNITIINSTAFYNPYLPSLGQSVVYNNEPSIITSGEVSIPDNSIINSGTTIIAKGKISIGNNVFINSDVKLISEELVSFDGENISSDENSSFVVTPNIWTAFCNGGNTNDYRATDVEIESACNSSEYTNAQRAKKEDGFESSKLNIKDQVGINLYPNPTANNLTVNFNVEVLISDNQTFTIDVYDAMGKMVISQNEKVTNTNSSFAVNTTTLREGIYYLKMSYADKNYQTKFVKIK